MCLLQLPASHGLENLTLGQIYRFISNAVDQPEKQKGKWNPPEGHTNSAISALIHLYKNVLTLLRLIST